METSRERVLKAINHIQPEVTPVHVMGFDEMDRWLDWFGAADYLELRDRLGLDIQGGLPAYTGRGAAEGLSIWGTGQAVMGSKGPGYSGVRGGYPLAQASSVADVERFAWPQADEFDYAVAAEVLRSIPADTARWVKLQTVYDLPGRSRLSAARGGGDWIPLLCTVFNLFGMEETLLKLHSEPAVMEAAVAHVEHFILEFSRRLLDATRGLIDIYWIGDDFAAQQGLILSPAHWRRFLKPSYRRIFDLTKSYGVKVWFHSCGSFRPVLPDLIDLGMDVWETVQVHLPGNEPEALKRDFGDHLAFYGAINSQATLPFGSPEEVRAEVRERIAVLGRGGGYICGSDHTILPDVPRENVLAMLDEAKRFRFQEGEGRR